jgi:hypothetical protein
VLRSALLTALVALAEGSSPVAADGGSDVAFLDGARQIATVPLAGGTPVPVPGQDTSTRWRSILAYGAVGVLVATDNDGAPWAVAPQTGVARRIGPGPTGHATFSPDGTEVVFTQDRGVMVAGVVDGAAPPRRIGPAVAGHPQWGPSGIAVMTLEGRANAIRIVAPQRAGPGGAGSTTTAPPAAAASSSCAGRWQGSPA